MKTFQSGNTIITMLADGTIEIRQDENASSMSGLDLKIDPKYVMRLHVDDLINFVGEVVREKKITALQRVSAHELLMGRRIL